MRPYWYPNDADEGRCEPSQVGKPRKEQKIAPPPPKEQALQTSSKPQPKKVKV